MTHSPLLDEHGQVTHVLQHIVDMTELQKLGDIRDEMGLIERVNEVQARNFDLSQETY